MKRKTYTYTAWLNEARNWCWRLCGCDLDDLADRNWHEMFEDGYSPRRAVQAARQDED